MDNVYNNFNDFNPIRKRKILIVFDHVIADMNTDKDIQSNSVRDLFIRRKKIEYISCIYHTILFFCSKRCQTKFYTLLNDEDL